MLYPLLAEFRSSKDRDLQSSFWSTALDVFWTWFSRPSRPSLGLFGGGGVFSWRWLVPRIPVFAMARVYRPRYPERTVLCQVLFHDFDKFLNYLWPPRPAENIFHDLVSDRGYSCDFQSFLSFPAAFESAFRYFELKLTSLHIAPYHPWRWDEVKPAHEGSFSQPSGKRISYP